MLNIHLTLAWRNLLKNKVASSINILGLTVGLTAALFAIVFAYHELSYESIHDKADRIARVYTLGKFGSMEKIPYSFGPVASELENNFPEVELTARSMSVTGTVFKGKEPISEKDVVMAEDHIFNIFNFTFLQGSKPSSPNSISISEKIANKYFETGDALGKILKINVHGYMEEYTITGIFKDFPSNTHAMASVVIPFELAYRIKHIKPDEYESTSFATYALLAPETNVPHLNVKIAELISIPVDVENVKCALVPIKRIHLHENIAENSKANFLALLIGGLVALIVTIFNYINHTTVIFSTRLKEIGVKKTVGGSKKYIFLQFFVDAGLSVMISFAFTLALFYALLPGFNQLMDTEIVLDFNLTILSVIVATLLITIFVSSLYPAIKSRKVNTINLIRDNSSRLLQKNRLVNSLITVQFIVAILLLQFIIITQKQTSHMFAQDVLKFNSNDVICLDGYQWGDLSTVKQQLLENPAVIAVSWGQLLPGANFNMSSSWKSEDNKEMANRLYCEKDYLKVFQIDMKKGRFFSDDFGSDDQTIVINPLTVESLGYADPLGKQVMVFDKQYKIIGVTDDYISVPPIIERMPLLILKSGNQSSYLTIRVQPEQRETAHQHIKKVLHGINPNQPVEMTYYDDIVMENAKTYIATEVFIRVFTLIIIVNAMLGLFSLSFFLSQRKTKEIGVRKVCGAQVRDVLWKLSGGFIKKLLLAFAIATPLGYVIGQGYISTFVAQIDLTADIFILGGFISFVMVVLSTGWKIAHAANQNPVRALRYE